MAFIECVGAGGGDFPLKDLKGHTVRCNVVKDGYHYIYGYFDDELIVSDYVTMDDTKSVTLKTEGDTTSLTNGSYTLEVGKYRPDPNGSYFAQVKLNDKVICQSPAFNRYNSGDTGTFVIT